METLTLLYETDKPNRNGRIYPKAEVKNALKEFTSTIEQRKAVGTFGQDVNSDNFAELNLCKVSHLITGYEEIPEGFLITAKILKTPNGIMLSELLDQYEKDGIKMAFGTRCTAELEGNVVKNMKLISIDILPSESYKL